MAHDANHWVQTHSPELPTSAQVGFHFMQRVVAHLALHADERLNPGEVWLAEHTQAKDLKVHRRDIQNARALLVDAGVLVPTDKRRGPGGARVWHLAIPGYQWPEVEQPAPKPARKRRKVDGEVDGVVDGVVDGISRHELNRTDIPPTPQTNTPRSQPDRAAGAGGVSVQAIVRQCEQVRRATFTGTDRGGLAQHWAKTDRPNAVQAMRENPGADLDTLVTATLALADNYQGPATAPRTAPRAPTGPQAVPDCPDCNGLGVVRTWQDSAQDYANHWCSCTQTLTQTDSHSNVSVSSAPNADSPGPGAQADPQSLVRDLSRRLRAVP